MISQPPVQLSCAPLERRSVFLSLLVSVLSSPRPADKPVQLSSAISIVLIALSQSEWFDLAIQHFVH